MNLTTETGSALQERRNGYRLQFPSGMRPVIATGGLRMDVLDISERGLRFRQHPGCVMAPDQFFAAVVEFASGRWQTVFGNTLRVSGDEIAACLYKGFDFNLLVEERANVMA